MNKDNYIKSMDQIDISEDFKERTEKLMKETRNQNNNKNTALKKMALTAAGAAIIIAAGAAAVNMIGSDFLNKNTNINSTVTTDSPANNTAETVASKGITVPEIQIADSQNSEIKGRMLPLFVYKGHIYIQSNTAFQTSDGISPNKEDVLSLQGDFLGTTKGSIDEWSSQDDYAKEFASTLGEGGKVYTVKGYDSDRRLMVYFEYEGGFGCELYDSFGGMTLNTGGDYFNILNLKDNIASYTWQSFDSWNNGKNEIKDASVDNALSQFIDSLYTSEPIGENIDMLTENTDYDSQKFVYITTKDNLITTLRLFKGGYVYDSQVGFFKVDDKAFQTFWDTLPVEKPADASVEQ